MADKYGVSKSEILDRDAKNMAVRVALGETAIIAETKQLLEKVIIWKSLHVFLSCLFLRKALCWMYWRSIPIPTAV